MSYEGGIVMKKIIRIITLALTCLLLFQTVMAVDIGGQFKVYAETTSGEIPIMPETPPPGVAPPPPFKLTGKITADIDCSEKFKC
jgi:hypothetical protein